MSYIQLNHVMKKFGDVIAIEDLNLSIEKRRMFLYARAIRLWENNYPKNDRRL